jgi:hypothetical protein
MGNLEDQWIERHKRNLDIHGMFRFLIILANKSSYEEMSEPQKENMSHKLKTVISKRRNYEYKFLDFAHSYIPVFKCK